MHFKLALLLLLLIGWTNVAIVILIVNFIITIFGKKIFARACSNFAVKYNEISDSIKIELFKDLNNEYAT